VGPVGVAAVREINKMAAADPPRWELTFRLTYMKIKPTLTLEFRAQRPLDSFN
jgi:hypothetical protein